MSKGDRSEVQVLEEHLAAIQSGSPETFLNLMDRDGVLLATITHGLEQQNLSPFRSISDYCRRWRNEGGPHPDTRPPRPVHGDGYELLQWRMDRSGHPELHSWNHSTTQFVRGRWAAVLKHLIDERRPPDLRGTGFTTAANATVDWDAHVANLIEEGDAEGAEALQKVLADHDREAPPRHLTDAKILDSLSNRKRERDLRAELRPDLTADASAPLEICKKWHRLAGRVDQFSRFKGGRYVLNFGIADGKPGPLTATWWYPPSDEEELPPEVAWAKALHEVTRRLIPIALDANLDERPLHELTKDLDDVLSGEEAYVADHVRAVEVLVRSIRARLEHGRTTEMTSHAEPRSEITVVKTGPDRAEVKEGSMKLVIKGPRRVWLLLTVVEANRSLSWNELVDADIRNAAGVIDRRTTSRSAAGSAKPSKSLGSRRRGEETPKMATEARSLQNLGSRIRRDLGKLAYHWHQDGTGVFWSPEAS